MPAPIRLAIADDHAILRQGIIAVATQHGIELVAEASNGQELLEQLSRLPQLPDVCMIDINMPVMNGYDTLRAIKQRWPQIHVLALSMHSGEYPILHMLRGGAGGYLPKDGPPENLYTAITTVVEEGFYHSELSTRARRQEAGSRSGVPLPRISDKELQFLSWCCCDLAYKEIAAQMGISPRTAESYAKILCEKLEVKSRIGLVTKALSMGLEPARPE